MKHHAEAQDESRVPGPWDPLNDELEQELAKESQLIKKDKLQEVCLSRVGMVVLSLR